MSLFSITRKGHRWEGEEDLMDREDPVEEAGLVEEGDWIGDVGEAIRIVGWGVGDVLVEGGMGLMDPGGIEMRLRGTEMDHRGIEMEKETSVDHLEGQEETGTGTGIGIGIDGGSGPVVLR